MTGAHRTTHAPWWVRLACWWSGHDPQPEFDRWRCDRCDQTARTRVELP